MQKFRVLTLNIWHDSPPWKGRRAAIVDWIRRLNPDVIGFQEVLRSPTWCQAEQLVEELPHRVTYGGVVRFWKRPHLFYGNAVATRWPVNESWNLELPHRDSFERRAALFVLTDTPFGVLPIVCTHFDSRRRDVRLAQMRAVLRALKADFELPFLIVGDLNASPESIEIRLASEKLCDVYEEVGGGLGLTWSIRNPRTRVSSPPGSRIDYVFVERFPKQRFVPVHSRVVCDQPINGVWPSDHFGVYAEFETD